MAGIEAGLRERRMGDAVRLQYDPDLPADVLTTLVTSSSWAPRPLRRAGLRRLRRPVPALYRGGSAPPEGPAAPAAPGRRLRARPRRLERDPPGRHPGPSPVSHVRRGHPLRAGGGARSRGARDQDDALPREPDLADRAGPHARRRDGQGGHRARRAAGALRRGGEHPLGARARRGRAPTSSTGSSGYKTHCKACLIVRQEGDGIRRYCHLATGNYNVRTAGVYTDLGLFTCRRVVRRGPDRAVQPA